MNDAKKEKKPRKKTKAKSGLVEKGHDFCKKNKVSVWASQQPYADIPDEYFTESFSKNNTRASNTWTKNFNLKFFNPEYLETNGAETGVIAIEQAAGQCSYSSSYMTGLMSKARKAKLEEVSWVVLLYDCEYSVKLSGVNKDNVLTFLGAFDYDDSADNLYDIEE